MLQVPRILWFAITFSTVVFVGLLLFAAPQPAGPPQQFFLVPALAMAALTTIAVSFVLPAKTFQTAVANSRVEITEVADQSSSDVLPYRDAPRRRVFAKPADARRRAVVIFQTPFILKLALTESVALHGFALGWLGFPVAAWAPFFAVAWVLFALHFPTDHAVFGRFAQAKGAAYE